MLDCILVPLDGTRQAESALQIAANLIVPWGKLIIIRIISHMEIGGRLEKSWLSSLGFEEYVLPSIPDLAIQEAQEYMQTVISINDLEVKYETQVLIETPHTKILEIAQSEEIQAIIMYRHLYPALKSWVSGEISSRIVQNASCPIILVTPNTKV